MNAKEFLDVIDTLYEEKRLQNNCLIIIQQE